MIEHLVFNCQSSRVGPWDALSSAPEDRRRRTGISEQRSENSGQRTEFRSSDDRITTLPSNLRSWSGLGGGCSATFSVQ